MVALSAGAFSGNTLDSVLERALVSSFLCFLAGGAMGLILDGVLERHAQKLRIEQADDGNPEQNLTSEEAIVTSSDNESPTQAVA